MPDAYIFDHVRTPRGRGKPDGALHAATPVHLAATVLSALRDRSGLDTAQVSDIVMGVVMPIGEQGQCLPRIAALRAGYHEEVAGVQINRFCGSGLEAVNMASAKVMAGQADMVIGGGCESMSRIQYSRTAARGARIRTWPSPPVSCRRASAPTSSPPNGAMTAPPWTASRWRAIAAPRGRGRKDASPAPSCPSPTTSAR